MKFNALVAAAMVITSVSASGKGRPKGLFKKGGGMKGSDSSWSLLEKDPEPGSSQDSPRRGMGQRLSQSTLVRKLKSGSSRSSPKHKPRPGPSQDSLAHGSRPVFPQKRPVYKPDTPQAPEPRKKDPVCDPIVRELQASWGKISDSDLAFRNREPDFHKLLTKEGSEKRDRMMEKKLIRFKKTNSEVEMSGNELIDMIRMTEFEKTNGVIATSGEEEDEDEEEKEEEKEKERNAHDLIVGEMQKWIESNPKSIPGLQEFKAESIGLEKDHGEIWKNSKITTVILKDSNICPQKS
ncbi:hypothetical protein BASA60_002426 [Batrachochytrium salamandrivorans]|nr:hypothetical protein BASA60_002426 [Batrachochytrium salamandrivorans]